MKCKFRYCGKLKFAVIIFLLVLPIYKANAQMIDFENDNLRYFHDIAFDSGKYTPTDGSFSSGTMTSFSGSYFWNKEFGIRIGVSLITDLDGSDKYFKVPVLFSFRTRTFRWLFDHEAETWRGALLEILLSLLPTRFEFNIGPSFGHITPQKSAHYTIENGKEILRQTSDANYRFAASIDANIRIGFQFWRVCVNGNIGCNYLFTNNFDYRIHHPYKEKINSLWFLNASAGLSFRF